MSPQSAAASLPIEQTADHALLGVEPVERVAEKAGVTRLSVVPDLAPAAEDRLAEAAVAPAAAVDLLPQDDGKLTAAELAAVDAIFNQATQINRRALQVLLPLAVVVLVVVLALIAR